MIAAHTPPPRTTSKLLDTATTTDQGPAEFVYLVASEAVRRLARSSGPWSACPASASA